MSLFNQWNVKSRAHKCHATQRPFVEGEPFHTALFQIKGSDEWERRDYSEEAWKELDPTEKPFSHWRGLYQPPMARAKEQEPLEKGGAEALLRRLMEENHPATESTRYILALMLERKKIFRQTDRRPMDEATFLIYEHVRTGEIYPVADPGMRLDDLESVQNEVATLLSLPMEAFSKAPPEVVSQERHTPSPSPHDNAPDLFPESP